jgi:uncharacterized protein
MSWETAKKAIDFLLRHSVDSPSVNVGFYGGEPLLEFDLIKQAIEYCKKLFVGKELTFNLTTNGTLLTKEKILFLEEQGVILTISLDGPKEINDINRVFKNGEGTFDSVMTAIQLVREVAQEYAKGLQISMVIDPQNDFDCLSEICFEGAELDKLMINASLIDFDYDERVLSFSKEYAEKSEYQRFLALLAIFGRYPEAKLSPIVAGAVDVAIGEFPIFDKSYELRETDAPSGPCIPGQLRLFVNVHGDFLPCERVSEISPAMQMGNLEKGFDIEKAEKILNIGALTLEECKKCWAFRHCSMCAKMADNNEENLSGERKITFCEQAKRNAFSKMRNYLLLKEVPIHYQKQTRKFSKGNGVS